MNVFTEIATWHNAYKLMKEAVNNNIVYVNIPELWCFFGDWFCFYFRWFPLSAN